LKERKGEQMCKRERQVGAAKTNECEREREKKENRDG